MTPAHRLDRARASYLRACELDVAVRKPGNVSRTSAGHGMDATLFLRSARVSVEPLLRPGARVGPRIEAAVRATRREVGCNTNLGILLLCAPIALAFESAQGEGATRLRDSIEAVLGSLDVADARASYLAIALAAPGGLGSAPEQDVQDVPALGLREAMGLAAERDRIARQYRDGFAELFEVGLAVLSAADRGTLFGPAAEPDPASVDAVQRLYLAFLASRPDSHIVRKHGAALAHSVMRSAQRWQAQPSASERLDPDPAFIAWDCELKAAGLNPGTSADLTVATLFLAGLWHGK